MPDPRYPQVIVHLGDLTGPDGNAFMILGRVDKALAECEDVPLDDRAQFMIEAKSGDYDHLLRTVKAWVSTDLHTYEYTLDVDN